MAAPVHRIGPRGYLNLRPIAKSELTTLYRAVRDGDHTPVLLKVWRTPCLAQDLDQLHNECLVLTHLRTCSSAAALLDAPHDDACPHLVFADFAAVPQQELQAPLALDAFLNLAVRCAEALQELHVHGVVHKNIRPASMLRDASSGMIKWMNFGIASLLSEMHQGATRHGLFEGALAYLAPEQTGRLNLPIDFRADLYALGCTLYEWLTGRPPFSAQNTLAWIRLHLAETPAPPVALRADVPSAVGAIILKLLQKTPDDRYQSAAGLAHDLSICANRWVKDQTVDDFPLATQDTPTRLFLPQRLYGRQAQAAVLEGALHAVQQRIQPQVVLLHGEPGIGKTSLVERLYKPLVRKRGYFISGKFDPYEQHKPYAGLSLALADLVQQALTEPPEILAPLQQNVRHTLGSKAALLTDVVPGIEMLLGHHGLDPSICMEPGEARQARHGALKQLIAIFASAQQPLVLFLDDLQWSDGASLDLLQEMATSPALSLVLTLAYRSNEIDAMHPVHTMLTQLHAAKAHIHCVALPPLDAAALTAMIQEATGNADVAQLATLVLQKTLGNPFFAREFLLCLWHKKILTRSRQTWHWDMARVASLDVSSNLADMLSSRLQALPKPTQRALEAASCLGLSVDIATLARALDADPQGVETAMQEAVQQLLVIPLPCTSEAQCYRFAHDRIQQAAAGLCNAQTAQLAHLRVGLQLLDELPASPSARQIFAAVNHLNAARGLIDRAHVQPRLRALNIAAGFEAKAACAFAAAQAYFTYALASGQADDDFAAWLALAEVQYAQHDTEAAEATLAQLLQHTPLPAERARAYALWLRILRTGERAGEAVQKFRAFYTELLGELPADTDVFPAIVAERENLDAYLQGRPAGAFLALPRATDATGEALCGLLREAATLLIMTSPPMCLLVTLKIVTLSIRFGNTPSSCYGYSAYGMALSAFFDDATTGFDFAQVAVQLAYQLHAKRDSAHALLMLASINNWKNSPESSVPILERAILLFGDVGDFEYAGFCVVFRTWALLEKGATIDAVVHAHRAPLDFLRKHGLVAVEAFLQLGIANIQALTDDPQAGIVDANNTIDLDTALLLFDRHGFRIGSAASHVLHMVRHCLYWQFEAALPYALAAESMIITIVGHTLTSLYYFYRGVLEANLCRDTASLQGQARMAYVDMCCCKLEAWAAHSPDNFLHLAQLLRAEQHRLRGDIANALRLYELSLQGTRRRNCLPYLAFSNELVARSYLALGADELAYYLLRRARFAYAQWGATGKVQQLDRKFAMLQEQFETEDLEVTAVKRGRHLDWQSIVKATQTISGEMAPARLLPMLLEVVRESAGAQRACILLLHDDNLWLEANLADGEPALACRILLDDARGFLSTAVANYVQRTKKTVILADARADSIFSRDAYIIDKQPKSLLCQPIIRHGLLQGVLYLENNTMTSAFNADRAAVLDIIASQVAISIDNARLYVEAQAAVRDRESFLGIAAHELKTPLTSLQLQVDGMARWLRKQSAAVVEGKIDSKIERAVSVIGRQTRRINHLINDLLDVTQIRAGKLTLHPTSVDLADLARNALEDCYGQLQDAHCAVVLDAHPAAGRWDASRISQIITNLLTNASKYASGSAVHMQVTQQGKMARLEVEDHGAGIPSAVLPRIFLPFERNNSTRAIAGLGLGLYICQQIARAHGGDIAVESHLGQGTTFTLSLPRD